MLGFYVIGAYNPCDAHMRIIAACVGQGPLKEGGGAALPKTWHRGIADVGVGVIIVE